jgi:hypothetical protein
MEMAIKPSRIFVGLLLFMHATAVASVYLTSIPLPVKLALFLLITFSMVFHLARDVLLLLPDSWRGVTHVTGGLSITTRDGKGLFGRLEYRIMVSPYFIVLRVRAEGRRLPVSRVIFPDAMEAGIFRKLCVQLKYS